MPEFVKLARKSKDQTKEVPQTPKVVEYQYNMIYIKKLQKHSLLKIKITFRNQTH